MTLTEMKQKKQELGYSNEQIAELSGVPFGTVQKIFSGITKRPRYATLQALEKIFTNHEPASGGTSVVKEKAFSYETRTPQKRQGEYTLEDYYALPDDRRAELIDGIIYDMTSPNLNHQLISANLHMTLYSYVRDNNGKCLVLSAPLDVQLDCDNRTMVQPDVIILCGHEKQRRFGIFGAPDFLVEILSPSTRAKDLGIKFTKYKNAGVREYWIIDPEQEIVLVYDFSQEIYPVIYGFQDKIPVGIFDGKCIVDFSEVTNNLYRGEE